MIFQDYLMIDWSAANERRTGKDSIWYLMLSRGPRGLEITAEGNPATRLAARQAVHELLVARQRAGRRTLVGCDFPFGLPRGVTAALNGDWRSTWRAVAARISDDAFNANNRFEVAAGLNQVLTGGPAPFWGCPVARRGPFLSDKKPALTRFPEFRHCEQWSASAKAIWQLYGSGSVGSQALMGMPAVLGWRYAPELAEASRVWPFETGLRLELAEPWTTVFAEVYPSLVPLAGDDALVKDRRQVEAIARHFAALDDEGGLAAMFAGPANLPAETREVIEREEGWILGLQEDRRRKAHPRGCEFPNEGFVQRAIEAYFREQGYALPPGEAVDLYCRHPRTGACWLVEAKGKSAAIGTDFNTGLGQLLKRMRDGETARFGLAVPDIPAYSYQIALIGNRVRQALDLHWLLVAADSSVRVISPQTPH